VVQAALWEAGAGTIGEYSNCSFVVDGTGSFEGSSAANPAVGQAQRLEQVSEARLEVVCPEPQVAEALRRLKGAHPYEEPACDVYPLLPQTSHSGSGRMGELAAAPVTLGDFIALVKTKLGVGTLPFVGDVRQAVSRVAIACGSGGEFLSTAIKQKCDVLLTGEARFHSCLEAREAGIAMILAGHYATERPGMEHLARILSREFPDVSVWASEVERDPVQWSPWTDLPPAP
jgi:hypothetical protein